MELEDTTNPVEVEDNSAEIQDEQQEVETESRDAEDGNLIEEDEEVELDDLKLKVPKPVALKLKELKDGALRQADYTRKTQELAETRRAFEAQRAEVVKATNEELEAFATIREIQGQLARYGQLDWNALAESEPLEAQKAFMHFQRLKDAFAGAQGQLSNARHQRLSLQQQETAKLIEQGREVLAKEIGWNDELKAKLTAHAFERGLSREDISDLEANPTAAMILRDAYEWRQHQAKTQAAQRHATAQQVTPAASVSARRAPTSGLDDRLSTEEWVRRRNEQARKRT